MARSACAAFGGCCSARTSWFPCVLLCVLLGLVTLPCVGRLCAQLLCCWRSSRFRALSFSAGTLIAARVRRRGGSMSLPASPCGCRVVPLAVGWYKGHRALLHMSPNLQTDLSLVFVQVVLGGMWCIVALLLSGLLRGSLFEDFTPGCPHLGARDSCESTPWLVVCSDHQGFGR